MFEKRQVKLPGSDVSEIADATSGSASSATVDVASGAVAIVVEVVDDVGGEVVDETIVEVVDDCGVVTGELDGVVAEGGVVEVDGTVAGDVPGGTKATGR